MMLKLKKFIRNETVFCIAFIAALLSAFIIPPSINYIGYINFSVLALLFCLMAAIEGLKQSGIFSLTASVLVTSTNGLRKLCFILMTLCFFSSMFITNDVALLTFVPLTIILMNGHKKDLIKAVVIETISANLGSMLSPIGNPQNLFIYEKSGMNVKEFILIMLPLAIAAYILLCISILIISRKPITANIEKIKVDKTGSIIYGILFILCILTVFHIISYYICTVLIIAVLLIYNRKVLLNVDYILLLTFVCFFIFSGNLAAIPQAENLISGLLEKNTMGIAVLCSQIISNVPCTVLLYPFSDNIKELLYGVGIGGLGTPVASLASLISYKIYANSENSAKGKYMLSFMLISGIFLIILYITASILIK